MATYAEISDDQKAQLRSFMAAYRPVLGEISRVFAKLSRLEDAWNGSIGAIVESLDAGEVVSPSSDLVGAGPVSKENATNTMTDFQQAMAAFYGDTNRQNYVNAAGLINTL